MYHLPTIVCHSSTTLLTVAITVRLYIEHKLHECRSTDLGEEAR